MKSYRTINEDVTITDPTLAQQYTNGKQQLANKDSQINALNKQILKLQADKIKIQNLLDQIEKKSADTIAKTAETNQPAQQPTQQNKDLETAQRNLASQILMNKPTTESLQTLSLMNLSSKLSMLEEEIAKTDVSKVDPAIVESAIQIKNEINRLNKKINPFSLNEFYDYNDSYVNDDVPNNLIYVEVTDKDNKFVAKIFKTTPTSEWEGKIIDGTSRTFEKMKYQTEYEEDDIVNFLMDSYDEVRVLSSEEFNKYEDDMIFYNLTIEELKSKYPNALITMEEKKPGLYYVRADVKTQGGNVEYLGAIKGLVTKDEGLKFLNNIIKKKYDGYY